MQMIIKITFILSCFYSALSFACLPAKISIFERYNRANNIYVGKVSNVQFNKKNNGISLSSNSNPNQEKSLSITVREQIKGDLAEKEIIVDIVNCGVGNASLNDKVLIFYTGKYKFVKKYKENEYQLLLSLNQ